MDLMTVILEDSKGVDRGMATGVDRRRRKIYIPILKVR